MSYAEYELDDGRMAGYAVKGRCDYARCTRDVWRGLDELCGDIPLIQSYRDRALPGEWLGCGLYFCGEHENDHGCRNPRIWEDDE